VTYPLEVLKTLYQTKQADSWGGACKIVWNRKSFFVGLVPFLFYWVVEVCADSVLNSVTVNTWLREKLKKHVDNKGIGLDVANVAVGVAKMTLLHLITCPIKTVFTSMQAITHDTSTSRGYLSSFSHCISIISEEGFGKLYSGFSADIIPGACSLLINFAFGLFANKEE
jgi:hypothetical protein